MIDKKELKKQYKQSLQPMGIYRIKNNANGKIFLGSSKNLPGKINSVKFQLEHGLNVNKDLQKDFSKVGKEQFTFEILDYLNPKEDPEYNYTENLKVLEEMWMRNCILSGREDIIKKKIPEKLL